MLSQVLAKPARQAKHTNNPPTNSGPTLAIHSPSCLFQVSSLVHAHDKAYKKQREKVTPMMDTQAQYSSLQRSQAQRPEPEKTHPPVRQGQKTMNALQPQQGQSQTKKVTLLSLFLILPSCTQGPCHAY